MKTVIFLLIVSTTYCVEAIKLRDGSLTLLYGQEYKVEPEEQTTVTFEYLVLAERWDMFMFVDRKAFASAGNTWYAEIAPRIKLVEFKSNWLKKLSFATTFERGKGGLRRDLYGVGFDFKVDYFRFLNVNILYRNDPDLSGNSYQITTVWANDFQIGGLPILFDGFIDWVFKSEETEKNFHFNPQLKLDMKKWLGGSQSWYLGFEYDYWDNKFGIADSEVLDSNQNTFSFLARWHF